MNEGCNQHATHLTTGMLSQLITTQRKKQMMQTGLLDWRICFKQLDNGGDPLPKIQTMVDWKLFGPLLEGLRDKNANPTRVANRLTSC